MEFQRGALPVATNIPLLTDPQRQKIGTTYRQQGHEAAVSLGYELVDSAARTQLIQQWQQYCQANPEAVLFCWRGGMRSSLVQQWLKDAGVDIPRVEGGFKALRRFLLTTLENMARGDNLIVVAGKTGSGKTHFINGLANSLDLEGLAKHRGSAFGRRVEPQPAQIDFENALAIHCLGLNWQDSRRVAVEDESRAIGSLSVPFGLHQRMLQSPVAMIEETLEYRIDTIHLDYIQSNYRAYKQQDPNKAEELFAASLSDALFRIRKRLGLERYEKIKILMDAALRKQQQDENIDDHRLWIAELLQSYYDPMYEYQMQKKQSRIVFRGNHEECAAWIIGLTEKHQ